MSKKMTQPPSLAKTYWVDVRERVAKVDSTFSKIVDGLNPDKSFPVYLAYYPYGSIIADTKCFFLPRDDGKIYRITDTETSKDIAKHLGYGKNSLPMGMVLEKQLEYYIDLKDEGITIPWLMYKPGSFFPFTTILEQKNKHSYAPNGVLMTTAGARSIFMLPNIGCVTNHVNLQRDFNIQKPAPKSLYEHWNIFKQIISSPILQSDWYCCVIYFSEKWIEKLYTDKSWLCLKSYLLELAWHRFEYDRNRVYYDIAFSVIQKKRNLKPNPYLADTARHLFAIALGAAPGYVPAINEDLLPLYTLQKVYIESYGLKKYSPTIMQPINYNFENNKNPIYYSLQHPSTYSFSPKSRKLSSTLFQMRELEHIMKIFTKELAKNNSICSDTILNKIANIMKFEYFHNEADRHKIIKHSSEIAKRDNQFNVVNSKYKLNGAKFSEDAKFVRGCISIKSN